jgi:hypothetical protein
MNQVYTPYTKWECYKNGMWSKVDAISEQKMLQIAIGFTSDHVSYGSAMREVVFAWENSMLNFLTNKSINRRAYLGHCAVSFKLGIPEYIVRMAWKHLTPKQQQLADLVAERTIKEWEIWYMRKLKNISKLGRQDVTTMDCQMSLQLK